MQSDPDWIVLTSFNEWFENTHIEPGVMYGYEYLQRTARLAAQFHAWRAFPTLYVNPAYSGPADGSSTRPFRTLTEALIAAADGATLHLAGGVYTGTFTLTRSVTLLGGYDPATWTRDPSAHPTILRGNGGGPVVRVLPNPCRPTPSVTLDGLTITGGAPGIHVTGAALTLAHITLADNHAPNHGGGLLVEQGGQAMIHASRILSNTASAGGGVFVGAGARAWLTNTVVAGNQATVAGGGIYIRPDASLSVVNSTITANRAPGGAAGLYAWTFQGQTMRIVNTILWGNDGADDVKCIGYCDITYSDVGTGWTGTTILNVEPRFRAPAQVDYHLRPDSPLIDAGHPAGALPNGPAPATDMDGETRPMGARVDIGADEVGPLLLSSLTADKPVAWPGDVIRYTITLTSTVTPSPLSFRVTDTLPLSAEYVPGSLRHSTGQAAYTATVGTLFLPRILWSGTLAPRGSAWMSFAVAVPNQTLLYWATITNTASIQTPLALEELSTAVRISDGVVARLVIQDAPGPAGRPITTRTLRPGESLTAYAAGYDSRANYLRPIQATWRTSGTLEARSSVGERFIFTPSVAGGAGKIIAQDGPGLTGETGLIAVIYPPPQIAISPPFLSSTQRVNQTVTRPFTLSNPGGSELSYQIRRVYTRPFTLTYEWKDSFFVDVHTGGVYNTLDYYLSPEQIDARFSGGDVRVMQVELQSHGVNLADRINWDWEVHLSNRDIALPEGQIWNSPSAPGSGSGAPCQLALVVGDRQDSSSYVYTAGHQFGSGATSVYPYYQGVKRSVCAPMHLTDGLHAQVVFWSGDPRVTLQFDRVRLTVRGVVTYTMADWLNFAPASGAVGGGSSQVVQAVFNARGLGTGIYTTLVPLESNDPAVPLSLPTARLQVTEMILHLPLVMRAETW